MTMIGTCETDDYKVRLHLLLCTFHIFICSSKIIISQVFKRKNGMYDFEIVVMMIVNSFDLGYNVLKPFGLFH